MSGPTFGDRVLDGGEMGTIVRCHECGGSGQLHKLDNPPNPSIPEPHDEITELEATCERQRRELEFLTILADGAPLKINGIPWREAFERLNALVSDPVPPIPDRPGQP